MKKIENSHEISSKLHHLPPGIPLRDPCAAPCMDAPRCCRTHTLELRAQSSQLSVEEAVELAQLHANSDGDAWMMLVGRKLRVK